MVSGDSLEVLSRTLSLSRMSAASETEMGHSESKHVSGKSL
jgi:hypothetical protein